MRLFEKFFNFFKKKPDITIIEEDSKLYHSIKDSMDNFEKNTSAEKIAALTAVIKHLVLETAMLKQATANQNEVLMNLVLVNQRILGLINGAIALENDAVNDEEEVYVDDEDEEDLIETAEEKSIREAAKKFGAN